VPVQLAEVVQLQWLPAQASPYPLAAHCPFGSAKTAHDKHVKSHICVYAGQSSADEQQRPLAQLLGQTVRWSHAGPLQSATQSHVSVSGLQKPWPEQ
jgi:hypothetical protein